MKFIIYPGASIVDAEVEFYRFEVSLRQDDKKQDIALNWIQRYYFGMYHD